MKPSKILFINKKLGGIFNELDENDPIKKSLKKAILEIKENAYAGRNVRKKLVPKVLIKKYSIPNLWIYNLPSAWRLLYSITTKDEVEIVAVLLDWMSHKDYERLFKF